MQYSSYITSTQHKDSYTINVLHMFTLHIPAICAIMTDIDCFSDMSLWWHKWLVYAKKVGWFI